MNNRLASTMLPGFHETAEKFFSHDKAVEPPHLTSEYFKTLSQQEKEQAWKDWANICYKYIKEREEADKLYEECIDKYLEGYIKMKSMDFEEMKNDKEDSK